jgi:hypothetical protein
MNWLGRRSEVGPGETAFMKLRPLFFAFLPASFLFMLANCSTWLTPSAAARQNCPITKPSDRPFVPPAPYPSAGGGEFLYGIPALWTVVKREWQLHGFAGQKMPYFRRGYEWRSARD